MNFFTTMVGYAGLKQNSTKITERDEALIISCRPCLFFIVFWWQKKNIAFKIYIYFQHLIIEFFWFAKLRFRIEEKMHTKSVFDVSRGEEIWKLFCLGEWGTNDSLGGKVCLERARGWRKICELIIKWALSKTVSEESADSSWTLPTGCFLDALYWIALQKLHISGYVCKTCLKELAINTWKPFCHILKTRISRAPHNGHFWKCNKICCIIYI